MKSHNLSIDRLHWVFSRVAGSEAAEFSESTAVDSFASIRASCALRLPSRPGVHPRVSTLSACTLQAERLQNVETLGSIFNTGFRVLGGPRDSFETTESSGSTISDSFASIRASCALRLPLRGRGTSEVFAIELEGRRSPQNASILQPWQLLQKR